MSKMELQMHGMLFASFLGRTTGTVDLVKLSFTFSHFKALFAGLTCPGSNRFAILPGYFSASAAPGMEQGYGALIREAGEREGFGPFWAWVCMVIDAGPPDFSVGQLCSGLVTVFWLLSETDSSVVGHQKKYIDLL